MKPRKYNSSPKEHIVSVETRQDKRGNVFFMVSFPYEGNDMYITFEHISSVIDFIKSNF